MANKIKKFEQKSNLHPKFVGYIRVSTDKQSIEPQKFAIYEYCKEKGINISNEKTFKFINMVISSRKSIDERKVMEAIKNLEQGDTIIVAELSRLGRSTVEVLTIWKEIAERKINLIILDNKFLTLDQNDDENAKWMKGMIITFISQFAELERKLVSQRTSIALAAKRDAGIPIGKPKGKIQSSIYDPKKEEIIYYLSKGISLAKITNLIHLGKRQSLFKFIKSRKLQHKALKLSHNLKLEDYLADQKKKAGLES